MIKIHFKTAWRNLLKRKGFFLINILGLAISIACCILICTYIYNQLTYDSFSKESKNIYRIERYSSEGNVIDVYPSVDVAVGPGLKEALPQISAYTRMVPISGHFMRYGETQYKEHSIALVDANFFEMFTIPFIFGNDRTALTAPNTVVITKAFSKKYFGNNDPVGKHINYSVFPNDLKVAGVIEAFPNNSHFHFDAFISRATVPNVEAGGWINTGTFTYVKLNTNADAKKLQAKFPEVVATHAVSEIQKNRGVAIDKAQQLVNALLFKLRPVRDIHLYSKTKYELEPPGDIQYVYIFGALAVFILLLACVNFVNLATASAATRSKEVGIRKVMGSLKNQLVIQFLVESVLASCCALFVALIFLYLLLPSYSQLSGEEISFSFFINLPGILAIAGFTLFTGLIAGIYPAFFMSSFQPVKVLKGLHGTEFKGRSLLRNGLVVFQFSVSLILIVATLVIYNQLNYMQHRKLGYNKDQVLIVSNAYLLKQNQEAFKQQLLQHRLIAGVSNAFGSPADAKMGATQVSPMESKGNENHSNIHVNIYNVDYDYIPVLQMEMATGRNFSRNFPSDSIDGVIVNQAAARDLGWNDSSAIGSKIKRAGQKTLNVVGVVKDFQYASARQSIAPLMMLLRQGNAYLVRINTADVKAVIAEIQRTWNSFNPGAPFEYSFLDDNFHKQYRSEEITGKTFSIFSVIAILIAGMGLIGLISYITATRTREIGVRKVLGASVFGIVFMLAKTFITLVIISVFIAVPISWWLMNNWLEDFAYKTNISWQVFVAAGTMTLLIALVTISFQAIKAAIANPVKSLRAE